jgi:hypothetical protein
MNQKELKSVIKQLVRESLTEIFAEMHLESIVENVIKKSAPRPVARQELITQNAAPLMESVNEGIDLKAKIRSMVAADDSEWADIYKDTVAHGHPVIDGEDSCKPELAPESALKQRGFMKDYSKFVK